jgi:1,4-dihydroxy-2-naphthoate octaprenyltransferase
MTAASDISPGRAWAMAIRPKTLPAAVAPVLVGTALALADEVFAPGPAIAALVCALLLQIGTNLANDYYDYVKGTDVAGRKGPTRVAQSGLITLPRLRRGMTVTFALAALVGVYLVATGGWPILVLGLASIVSALAYTGGPYPIGYHGLGDLFVFLFFGLAAVCGTYYVQALTLTWMVAAAAIPVGALTTAILVVNNLRDMDTDKATAKRTCAVILGAQGTRVEYVTLLLVAYAVPVLFWAKGWSTAWILLPWITLPMGASLVHTIHKSQEGPILNKALASTANLDLAFSLLFALGLIL